MTCNNQTINDLDFFKDNGACDKSEWGLAETQIGDCTTAEYNILESYPSIETLRRLAWINVIFSFVSTFLAVCYTLSIWRKEKAKIDGWPWSKVVYGVEMEKLRCVFPQWFIEFGLIGKLVPALSMDCIDILTDTMYFDALTKSCGILDTRLQTPKFVYRVLFAFMVIGMLKNIVVSHRAYKQLTKKVQLNDVSESDLVDSNAYMALTFFQGVLAFVFQDAVAAIIQYFYIDRYVTKAGFTAIANSVVMLLCSLRILYIFCKYIYRYHEKTDPLKMKTLHSIMMITQISICFFHATRSYAVVFSKLLTGKDNQPHESCYTVNYRHGQAFTKTTPFNGDCFGQTGYILLIMTGFSSIGVTICTIIILVIGFEHFKIFNQSHYSGRVGNISQSVGHRAPATLKKLQSKPDPQLSRATEMSLPPTIN